MMLEKSTCRRRGDLPAAAHATIAERKGREYLFSFVKSPTALSMRIAVLALCGLILAVPDSHAEDTGGFPGFLQHLFGFTPKSGPQPRATAPPTVRVRQKKRQDYVSPSATRPRVEKTSFVAVLGDTFAILAAQGLSDAFSTKPDVGITNAARDLSGLARNDYYDWPKAARDLAAGKKKIDVAIIMLGLNDLQPLKDGGETLDPLTDKWKTIYGQRVEDVVAPFRDAHIPVLWVGLPSMPDERLNAQALALNEIYRDHAEKAGGNFIDIWEGFVDQNGQYSAFGPDVEGQSTRLRSGANGVYLTKAGARKLAQYLEPEVRRAIDKGKPQNDISALPPDIEQQADDINAEIRREMGVDKSLDPLSPPKLEAGPILSLTARPKAANAALVDALSADRVDAERRLGLPVQPRPGRADDFSWPPPQ